MTTAPSLDERQPTRRERLTLERLTLDVRQLKNDKALVHLKFEKETEEVEVIQVPTGDNFENGDIEGVFESERLPLNSPRAQAYLAKLHADHERVLEELRWSLNFEDDEKNRQKIEEQIANLKPSLPHIGRDKYIDPAKADKYRAELEDIKIRLKKAHKAVRNFKARMNALKEDPMDSRCRRRIANQKYQNSPKGRAARARSDKAHHERNRERDAERAKGWYLVTGEAEKRRLQRIPVNDSTGLGDGGAE